MPDEFLQGETSFPRPVPPDIIGMSAQDALALHIGQIMMSAASLDGQLTLVISNLVNRERPPHDLIRGRNVGDKLRMLKASIPPGWSDGGAFVNAIHRLMNDRNDVAHSSPAIDIESYADGPADAPLPLVLGRENSKLDTPIDFDRLFLTRVDLALLTDICLVLVLEILRGRTEVSIVELALGWHHDPSFKGWTKTTDWEVDVKRVFQLP